MNNLYLIIGNTRHFLITYKTEEEITEHQREEEKFKLQRKQEKANLDKSLEIIKSVSKNIYIVLLDRDDDNTNDLPVLMPKIYNKY